MYRTKPYGYSVRNLLSKVTSAVKFVFPNTQQFMHNLKYRAARTYNRNLPDAFTTKLGLAKPYRKAKALSPKLCVSRGRKGIRVESGSDGQSSLAFWTELDTLRKSLSKEQTNPTLTTGSYSKNQEETTDRGSIDQHQDTLEIIPLDSYHALANPYMEEGLDSSGNASEFKNIFLKPTTDLSTTLEDALNVSASNPSNVREMFLGLKPDSSKRAMETPSHESIETGKNVLKPAENPTQNFTAFESRTSQSTVRIPWTSRQNLQQDYITPPLKIRRLSTLTYHPDPFENAKCQLILKKRQMHDELEGLSTATKNIFHVQQKTSIPVKETGRIPLFSFAKNNSSLESDKPTFPRNSELSLDLTRLKNAGLRRPVETEAEMLQNTSQSHIFLLESPIFTLPAPTLVPLILETKMHGFCSTSEKNENHFPGENMGIDSPRIISAGSKRRSNAGDQLMLIDTPTVKWQGTFESKPGAWICSNCLLENEDDEEGICLVCGFRNVGMKNERYRHFDTFGNEIRETEISRENTMPSLKKTIQCNVAQKSTLWNIKTSSKITVRDTNTIPDSWECDVCLHRNYKNTSKCFSCETMKLFKQARSRKFTFKRLHENTAKEIEGPSGKMPKLQNAFEASVISVPSTAPEQSQFPSAFRPGTNENITVPWSHPEQKSGPASNFYEHPWHTRSTETKSTSNILKTTEASSELNTTTTRDVMTTDGNTIRSSVADTMLASSNAYQSFSIQQSNFNISSITDVPSIGPRAPCPANTRVPEDGIKANFSQQAQLREPNFGTQFASASFLAPTFGSSGTKTAFSFSNTLVTQRPSQGTHPTVQGSGAGFQTPYYNLQVPSNFNFGAIGTAGNQPFQFQGNTNENDDSTNPASTTQRAVSQITMKRKKKRY